MQWLGLEPSKILLINSPHVAAQAEQLPDIGPPGEYIASGWHQETYLKSRDDDIMHWLQMKILRPQGIDIAASRNYLARALERCGLSHLALKFASVFSKAPDRGSESC